LKNKAKLNQALFTKVAYTISQEMKNAFGQLAYAIEAIKSLNVIENFKLKIEYDGQVIEDDFAFGAILNSRSLGGMIKLGQEKVNLSDGLFEALLVKNPHIGLNYKTQWLVSRNSNRMRDMLSFLVHHK
jgi:diacylglycerol kinase family enzyme